MKKHLLLVDYENIPRIDMAGLDNSYRALVFVGAGQNPPRAIRHKETAHRFTRVDFFKISGTGKNALDFQIAFHLGRVFETSPQTICIVVSRDKGYDPLLRYLNENGLQCRRIEAFAELLPAPAALSAAPLSPEETICRRCKQFSTIALHGGRWCANCGIFASPPDPNLLPSNQQDYRESQVSRLGRGSCSTCGWCHQNMSVGDGIYDDGEWMCGGCIEQYVN